MTRTTALPLLCVVSVLMLPLLAGCGGPESAQADTPESSGKMEITVVNQTRGDLTGVVVKASMPVMFGELDRGDSHTLGHRELEMTEKIKVRWIERGDKVHVKTLHAWRTLGRHYRGPVQITLRPDGVTRLRKAN
ncbi:MAG: hypothetical protein AAF750_03990 [Planctomycetota bacterium]